MYRHIYTVCVAVFLLFTAANAQKAEVTINLNEAFFDTLLDSVFQNFDPPEFSIATVSPKSKVRSPKSFVFGYTANQKSKIKDQRPTCNETIKILREMNGVRTAVHFREGKIRVPLAFSGSYAPPFVGCVDFAGWADTYIDLEFDQAGQRLIGRAHILSVDLNGTGGVGGSVIAKMLQGSIDKKLNPIEILSLDKISFTFPVQNSGRLRMRAVGVRPEISNAMLNIHIAYEFLKG